MRGMLISTLIMSIVVLSSITALHLYDKHDINVFSYFTVSSMNQGEHIPDWVMDDHNDYESDLHSNGTRPHYSIKAQLNDTKSVINGQLTVKLTKPSSDKLVFNNYPPFNVNNMNIYQVKINEQNADFSFVNNQLSIPLKSSYFDSKDAVNENNIMEAKISFSTRVPQMGTRFGVKDEIWLLTTWYPILGVKDEKNHWFSRPNPVGFGDPFYFDYADYDIHFLAPSNINWVTSGTLLEALPSDNNQILYHWQESMIRNFALVGSKHYTIYEFPTDNGVTIQIALTSERYLQEIKDILEYSYPLFKDMFGPLPYKTISVAETSWGTNYALEYPNLAIYSKDLYTQRNLERWLAHELAHIWWYNAVGNHEITDGWLDEGLAEHAVVLYLENRYGRDRALELRNFFRNQNKQLIARQPLSRMNTRLMDFRSQTDFLHNWYHRSADMFLTLREELGDIKYTHFLRTLFENNKGSIIGIEELNQSLQETIKGNHNYFNGWVNRPFSETPFHLKATPIPIKINGQHIPEPDVHYVDWEIYVPYEILHEILFKGLGNPLQIDESNGQIYFSNQLLFSLPAVFKNGQLLLPIEIIRHISEHQFVWDFERDLLTINVYYFK